MGSLNWCELFGEQFDSIQNLNVIPSKLAFVLGIDPIDRLRCVEMTYKDIDCSIFLWWQKDWKQLKCPLRKECFNKNWCSYIAEDYVRSYPNSVTAPHYRWGITSKCWPLKTTLLFCWDRWSAKPWMAARSNFTDGYCPHGATERFLVNAHETLCLW